MIPFRVSKQTKLGEILREIPNTDTRHPITLEECLACGELIGSGVPVIFVYIGAAPEDRKKNWFTGGTVPLHKECYVQ